MSGDFPNGSRRLARTLSVALAAVLVLAGACSRKPAPRVDMHVASLGRDSRSDSPVVVLEADEGPDVLHIWIGFPEARAISMAMEGIEPPRPMTHDLMRDIVGKLGGRLLEVEVSDLRDSTFIATLAIEVQGKRVTVDARPSDAIALSLRAGTPIRVRRDVLDRAQRALRDPRAASVDPWGIAVQMVDADLAEAFSLQAVAGVLVNEVRSGGLGAAIGLRRGDVINRVNAEMIASVEDFSRSADDALTGEQVELVLQRDGDFILLTADLP